MRKREDPRGIARQGGTTSPVFGAGYGAVSRLVRLGVSTIDLVGRRGPVGSWSRIRSPGFCIEHHSVKVRLLIELHPLFRVSVGSLGAGEVRAGPKPPC